MDRSSNSTNMEKIVSRNHVLVLLVLIAATGCGGINPGVNPDPTPIKGKVTLKGKPLSDVTITFQPTGVGGEATMAVKNGEFKGSVIPGKYTYYFSDQKRPTLIPEHYRAGSMERQIDVKPGDELTLAIE